MTKVRLTEQNGSVLTLSVGAVSRYDYIMKNKNFLNWSSARGTLNGLVEGGPVWFTELASGGAAAVWATCGNGDLFEYRLAVYSGVPNSHTSLYGADNVEMLETVGFNSPLEFRSVAAGLL